MSFTVFLGNLPTWVTADDIKQWLAAEDLVADAVKVIRNHETQESKGFAFVEAPTNDEMQSIIRRFDRAPLEDRLLRANPAQPPKGKDAPGGGQRDAPGGGQRDAPGAGQRDGQRDVPRDGQRGAAPSQQQAAAPNAIRTEQRPDRKKRGGRNREQSPRSAFATELAKVL